MAMMLTNEKKPRMMVSKRRNRSRAFDKSYYDRERRVRRWFGEVIIIFYQMPVLVEARGFGSASTHLFEDSRRCVSCGVRERKVTTDSRVLLMDFGAAQIEVSRCRC
jgi:hypothetical protein